MSAIQVRCIRGTADREAPSISDSLISNQSMAVARGKRFLDDPSQGGYYKTIRRVLRVPHKNNSVLPGKWVTINSSRLGLIGQKMKVLDYEIEITRTGIFGNLTALQFVEP